MKEQPAELLCSKSDDTTSLEIERGARSRGRSFEEIGGKDYEIQKSYPILRALRHTTLRTSWQFGSMHPIHFTFKLPYIGKN